MGITTWVDRITDETNLWLSAGKAEEAKDYQGAIVLYLEDASACLERNSLVRGALSCNCAAECFSIMGARAQAIWLYSEAGRLYAGIDEHAVSGSIREALWALQRAYACYVLAGDEERSRGIMDAYKFLGRRANPFAIGSQWLEMPKVIPGRQGGAGAAELGPEVKRAFEDFFARREAPMQPRRGRRGSAAARGAFDDQESIVSQLG